MARRPNSRIPAIQYRGATIRLYRHRDRWKATFQLHGHKHREAAMEAISRELDPIAVADSKDEVTARALLDQHGVSLTEAARLWIHKNNKPLIEATAEQVTDYSF